MDMPKDPVMLLSFINTQLRDNYSTLSDLCKAYDVSESEISDKLSALDYHYDLTLNKFI
ncbi:MAG: DUF4250 domain-containing protein [Lachnospiraceae bacterium]|nr:DUF4250 domain-containing protein [Lachnospiraceae bacterium]